MATRQVLYVDGRPFALAELGEALDTWLLPKPGTAAYLIYVHGKGKEPQKTLNVLPELEAAYAVRPIVLHWQPSDGKLKLVEAAAQAAGPALCDLLTALQQRVRPVLPVVLLTQSMGNYAAWHLGRELARGAFELEADLLSRVVLNAAAVPAKDHRAWLAPIAQRAATYVVANDEDNILQLLDLKRPTPLGRKPDAGVLAASAFYLDISGYNQDTHRHYKPDAGVAKIPKLLRAFYDQVLRGLPPALVGKTFEGGQITKLP